MKRSVRQFIALSLCFSLVSSIPVFASETVTTQNQEMIAGPVDDYVYEMIEDYENGVFVERNDVETLEMATLFDEESAYSNSGMNVTYLYDNREIAPNTYAATQIVITEGEEDSDASISQGVKAVCVIEYNLMDVGDWYDYIMLTNVKGAILYENDDYDCTRLQLKYEVRGDAYDEDGNRYGWKGDATSFDDRTIYDPLVGFYYLQPGPRDYYYCMGVYGSLVAGFLSAKIENSAGDVEYLSCQPAFEAV